MSSGRHHGFRRRGSMHERSLHFGPNMTPMVDVVMVILVFFMASAAFVGPEWFLKSLMPQKPVIGAGQTNTGRAATDLPPVRLEITLDVDSAGRTVATGVGQTDVDIAGILKAVVGFAEGTPKDQIEVLIRASGKVPYRDVVRVHEGCDKAGIVRVGVGVSQSVK